jgi:hypothetical protein
MRTIMAQKERRSEESLPRVPVSHDSTKALEAHIRYMSGMQREMVGALTEVGQRWMTQASA